MSLSSVLAMRRFLPGAAAGIRLATAASARPSRRFERAGSRHLDAAVRAGGGRRATRADAPPGMLEAILANNLRLRRPATEVIAVDLLESTVATRVPDGALRTARFNPADLTVTG